MESSLILSFGLEFSDLYTREGLVRLDLEFCAFLEQTDADLARRFLLARAQPEALDKKAESDLLVALAPHAEDFIGQLFGIGLEVTALAQRHHELAPLYSVKRQFVQRRAAKAFPVEEVLSWNATNLTQRLESRVEFPLNASRDSELVLAHFISILLEDEAAHAEDLDLALRYSAWALYSPEGRARHSKGLLFQVPHKIDPQHLVPVEKFERDGVTMLRMPVERHRLREGFDLTDPGTDLAGALDQANYCIWCHNQGKDSCSTGMRDRKTGAFQKNTHGVTLAGCPLDQKISEMNMLKAQGVPIGALAMVVVDNPMCAATGHRICNDCMKACIYQKQEPVDIPQAETRTLKDVLELPWGFEIYSLLTRWNPLNLRHPLPRPASNRTVLVAGMGPAGFTLSHYLMNDGHRVVGVDGLKIEPLPEQWVGKKSFPCHPERSEGSFLQKKDPSVASLPQDDSKSVFQPIYDIKTLHERLSDRVMAGFGGVAEYGITVRWDKNFLRIIRLLLERRSEFTLHGGVRFGGTLTVEQAFAMSFDHIALCMGAGKPTVIPMKNGLARGVRQASDFLMTLQLTGAARKDSLASLEVQLPVAVIGGGLTAIDTATEALAYYPVQVEKFLSRYETLVAEQGEEAVRRGWTEEERQTADTFIAHARELRKVRGTSQVRKLLDSWGGSTVVYRRAFTESPAYTLNHEEVAKAMEEGIRYVENATPLAVELDQYGHAAGLRVRTGEQEVIISARTILVAAGTQPNTVLARGQDNASAFPLHGRHFQALDEQGQPVMPERVAKPEQAHVLMSRTDDGRWISFFGDLHPSFSGNVVKAMASAKRGYPVISRVLETLKGEK